MKGASCGYEAHLRNKCGHFKGADNLHLMWPVQAWLCENPKRLVIPQKMRGYPFIWEHARKELDVYSRQLRVRPHAPHTMH